MNPEVMLFTVESGARVNMELGIGVGRGYEAADHKREAPAGTWWPTSCKRARRTWWTSRTWAKSPSTRSRRRWRRWGSRSACASTRTSSARSAAGRPEASDEARQGQLQARSTHRAPLGAVPQPPGRALPARADHDHRGQGQGGTRRRRAHDHPGQARDPPRAAPGDDDGAGYRGGGHALRHDRRPLLRPQRRLHAHHQDGAPPGRQRADGHPRAGGPGRGRQGAQGRGREEGKDAEGRGWRGREGQEEEGQGRRRVRVRMRRFTCAAALAALLAACAGVGGEPRGDRAPIDYVVVLFLENRAFDQLFGTYPRADGLANYRGRQVDKSGVTYATLPPPLGRDGKPDPRFPADLPNAPFPMLRFGQSLDLTNNPVHRFYHMQRQYGAGADGVPMGKWVAGGPG